MKRFYKSLFIIGILTILFFLPSKLARAADAVKTPMIIEVNTQKANLARPLVTGLVEKDSEVLVFANDIFLGNAIIQSNESETSSYHFQPTKALTSGKYAIKTVAKKTESGLMSEYSEEYGIVVPGLPAPTLILPNEDSIISKAKPLIHGLTRTDSLVHIYIDGVYNGKTKVLTHKSGTASFAYKPFLNLSVGSHKVWVVAEDVNGGKSKISNILKFNIEPPLPGAANVGVVLNQVDKARPFVTGLTKNNLFAKVFVDHELDGMIKVGSHESGTANFIYMIKSALTPGKHLIYVVTLDNKGKESNWSNFASVEIESNLNPEISEVAVSDKIEEDEVVEENETVKIEVVEKEKEIIPEIIDKEELKEEKVIEKESGEMIEEIEEKTDDVTEINDSEKTSTDSIDIDEMLSKEISTTSNDQSGAVTESNIGQGKSWSVLIFTLFLIAVIGWIFWVNRELIKEKNDAKDLDQENDEKNKDQ